MNFNSMPEKRIIFPQQSKEMMERKYEWMTSLLDGQFDDICPEKRPTILDFQGLNPGSTEKDFLKWIEREMGINEKYILDDGKEEESKKVYKKLNYAYQTAKIFLKETLKYKEEEISIGPEVISSKKDVFDLLKKTVLLKGQEGLSKSFLYCRLVKVTLASYETIKNDAEVLKNVTNAFESSLIASPSDYDNEAPLILINEDEKGKKFYASTHGKIKGNIISRGKDIKKAILRFITRPESNAEVALKDGIATRIIIEEEQALELIPILCNWLREKRKTNFLSIGNQSYLSEQEMKKLEKNLLQIIPKDSFSIKKETANPTSMGSFRDLKIKGILKSPGKSNKFISLAVHARQFEIQFVEPNNKNDKGRLNHEVYDVIKFVNARTRLDGGCPEKVFEDFVRDASKKSDISEEKIKKYLLEEKNAPILKMKKKNRKGKEYYYIAHYVYSRWNGFGWVDKELYSEIEMEKEERKNALS